MDTKHTNIKVWEDTFQQSDSGIFKEVQVDPSVKYTFEELSSLPMSPKYSTPVLEIINEDTFTMAQELVKKGYNPLVLNMASDRHPGGGVSKGAFAQEENLFRRSNYYKSLPKKDFYPIRSNEVVYSSNVLVFKNKSYNVISNPFQVGCIACAAIRNPLMTWTIEQQPRLIFANKQDIELSKKKIRAIFQVAYKHGHDSLVLGALGCGAFHNPPVEIAKIFNEVLAEYKYCFNYFCFAVYSIKDKNYLIFRETLNF